MHKAKGKEFDEVIIFEGWPTYVGNDLVDNSARIVWDNSRKSDLAHHRKNLMVSATRAKSHTTILTPHKNPCILLFDN